MWTSYSSFGAGRLTRHFRLHKMKFQAAVYELSSIDPRNKSYECISQVMNAMSKITVQRLGYSDLFIKVKIKIFCIQKWELPAEKWWIKLENNALETQHSVQVLKDRVSLPTAVTTNLSLLGHVIRWPLVRRDNFVSIFWKWSGGRHKLLLSIPFNLKRKLSMR